MALRRYRRRFPAPKAPSVSTFKPAERPSPGRRLAHRVTYSQKYQVEYETKPRPAALSQGKLPAGVRPAPAYEPKKGGLGQRATAPRPDKLKASLVERIQKVCKKRPTRNKGKGGKSKNFVLWCK